MAEEPETLMNVDQQLELARWLIERYDGLRASMANRAAMVLSADALLLAGVTFLLDKTLSGATQTSYFERLFFLLSIATTIICLSLSIVFAASAIAFVWKTSRESLGMKSLPPLWFFHARDTATHFKDLTEFEREYRATTKEQMVRYALGELFLITRTHYQRYQPFRQSIRLLLIALAALLVSGVILIGRPF
jgi:hypothetical protein